MEVLLSSKERRLIALAGALSGRAARADTLAQAMGVCLDPLPGQRRSTLNDDGSPLELCITTRAAGCRYRLLGEPASQLASVHQRLAHGQHAIQALLPLVGAAPLAALLEQAIEHWLPASPAAREQIATSVLGLAAGLDGAGIGLYLEGRLGAPADDWARLGRWFTRLLPQADAALDYLARISRYGQLACVGIEGADLTNGRAKIHWRLQQPMPLDRLGAPLLDSPIFPHFLAQVIGERSFDLHMPTFCTGFALSTGALVDTKIDLCGCPSCLALTPAQWSANLAALCTSFGLAALPIDDLLRQHALEGVCLGLGLDCQGQVRLNLYLKAGDPL